ncbi:MAG: hypothetical protein CMJ76_10715 [Planctomycetaceae bacterium]|nr:hypothetical protein [Planctomycetaceae bacterium]
MPNNNYSPYEHSMHRDASATPGVDNLNTYTTRELEELAFYVKGATIILIDCLCILLLCVGAVALNEAYNIRMLHPSLTDLLNLAMVAAAFVLIIGNGFLLVSKSTRGGRMVFYISSGLICTCCLGPVILGFITLSQLDVSMSLALVNCLCCISIVFHLAGWAGLSHSLGLKSTSRQLNHSTFLFPCLILVLWLTGLEATQWPPRSGFLFLLSVAAAFLLTFFFLSKLARSIMQIRRAIRNAIDVDTIIDKGYLPKN